MGKHKAPICPVTEEDLQRILSRGIDEFGLSEEIRAVCVIHRVYTIHDLYELSADSLVATEFTSDHVEILRQLLTTLGLKRRTPRPLSPRDQITVRCRCGNEYLKHYRGVASENINYREANLKYSSRLMSRSGVDRAFARDMLVLVNAAAVRKHAYEFFGYLQSGIQIQDCSISLEDLVAQGNLGMMRATEDFDPRVGVQFLTYAVNWIKQYIRRYVFGGGIIRIPVHLQQTISRYNKQVEKLPLGLTEEDQSKILCKKLEMTPRKFAAFVALLKEVRLLKPKRLDHRDSSDDLTGSLHETIPDTNSAPVDDLVHDALQQQDIKALVREAMEGINLTERFKNVLVLRFGLDGGEPKTLQEIGDMYGVTRETIRLNESDALEKMRKSSQWNRHRDLLESVFEVDS